MVEPPLELASFFTAKMPPGALNSMATKLLRRTWNWLRSSVSLACPGEMYVLAAAPPAVTGGTTRILRTTAMSLVASQLPRRCGRVPCSEGPRVSAARAATRQLSNDAELGSIFLRILGHHDGSLDDI
jgi:hypothetical protein